MPPYGASTLCQITLRNEMCSSAAGPHRALCRFTKPSFLSWPGYQHQTLELILSCIHLSEDFPNGPHSSSRRACLVKLELTPAFAMVQLTDRTNIAGSFASSVSSRMLSVRPQVFRDICLSMCIDEHPPGHDLSPHRPLGHLLTCVILGSLDGNKTPVLG